MTEVEGQVRAEEDDERRDPEVEARRRLALAQIRQWPDSVLRLRANEVEQFDGDLEPVAERMTQLMHDAQGVGLAATQVGILRRFFVFTNEDEDRLLVNPVITWRSDEVETEDEGCLSLGRARVPLERNVAVTIQAQNAAGKPFELELEGLSARVVQHELDHLDGILIIQRTDDESRREALRLLRPQPVLGAR